MNDSRDFSLLVSRYSRKLAILSIAQAAIIYLLLFQLGIGDYILSVHLRLLHSSIQDFIQSKFEEYLAAILLLICMRWIFYSIKNKCFGTSPLPLLLSFILNERSNGTKIPLGTLFQLDKVMDILFFLWIGDITRGEIYECVIAITIYNEITVLSSNINSVNELNASDITQLKKYLEMILMNDFYYRQYMLKSVRNRSVYEILKRYAISPVDRNQLISSALCLQCILGDSSTVKMLRRSPIYKDSCYKNEFERTIQILQRRLDNDLSGNDLLMLINQKNYHLPQNLVCPAAGTRQEIDDKQ